MHIKDNIQKVDETTKKVLYVLMIAIIPLLVILILYLSNHDSAFLKVISDRTERFPAVLSARNLLMSKVMDVYCKTAPLCALITFLSFRRIPYLKKSSSFIGKVKGFFLLNILFFIIYYVLFFCNHELTTSGKLLKLMSFNDYLLTFFYIILYAIFFFFFFFYLWVVIDIKRCYRER